MITLLLNECHIGDTKTFINAVAFNRINAARYKLINRQAVTCRWDKRPAAGWAGLYQEFVPCNGIQILESRKFLYVECGIPENFVCGIQNHGPWDVENSSWNPESKFHWQYWNPVPVCTCIGLPHLGQRSYKTLTQTWGEAHVQDLHTQSYVHWGFKDHLGFRETAHLPLP